MAVSAAQSVARDLGMLLVEEAQFLYGVEDKIEELHQELSWMQCFLQDVDRRQHKDELIRMWVSQVGGLAYEAQDIVEKYIHKVSNRHRGSVKRCSCRVVANARTIHEVGSDIDRLAQKISKLNSRLVSYGVKIRHVEDSQYVSRMRDLRHTYADIVEKDLIRRVEDTSKLVNELIGDRTNVVGVVGMGGLGKTTLAREVYRTLKDKFDCLAWIYVSQQLHKRLVLEEIYRALLKPNAEVKVGELDDGALCGDVKKALTEKRCLVVLDDIWYNESWLLLKHALSPVLDDSSRSKIMLTTRNEEVVSFVDSKAFILKPTTLNEEESWMLLRKKAFPQNDNAEINPEMKEVGEKMLKHCGGLPIAIVSLGGILATRNTVDEWKAVGKHIGIYLTKVSVLRQNETITKMGVKQVLEMSYNDLPFYLKPCFLCLGNFPEDTEIHTDMLYQLWQAEGFIRAPEENEVDDDVGIYEISEQYLSELVKRCMVEVGQVYKSGRIKTCRMHDVMRDLCLSKSKEDKFLEVFNITGDDGEEGRSSSQRQVSRCQRVVVHVEVRVGHLSMKLRDLMEETALKPRSAFVFMEFMTNIEKKPWFYRHMLLSKMSKSFGLLRVLVVDGVVKELPRELDSCIHLRYLSLGFVRRCKVSPVVWKLNYLQTLDLRLGEDVVIPNKLWKLKRLVHLYLPSLYKIVKGEKLKLSQPTQMETLVNIRLETFDADNLRKLTNLRMVSFNTVAMGGEHLKLVLNHIITSRLLTNPVSDFEIDAEGINEDCEILGSNPHANIERLTINGVIHQSLDRIVFPPTLYHLCLLGSKIQGDCIPQLKIPGLTELDLEENAIKGNKIVFSSQSFPQLTKLFLQWAPDRSQEIEVEGELPDSCQLTIRCTRILVDEVSNATRRLNTSASRRPRVEGRG